MIDTSTRLLEIQEDLTTAFDVGGGFFSRHADYVGGDWLIQGLIDARDVIVEEAEPTGEQPQTPIGRLTLQAVENGAFAEYINNPNICPRMESYFYQSILDVDKGWSDTDPTDPIIIFTDSQLGAVGLLKNKGVPAVLGLRETPELPAPPGSVFLPYVRLEYILDESEEVADGISVASIGALEADFGRLSVYSVPLRDRKGYQPRSDWAKPLAKLSMKKITKKVDQFVEAL